MGWWSALTSMQRGRVVASVAPQAAGHAMQCALQGVRVVLVSPQHAGNVGSVCRAAANFGIYSCPWRCPEWPFLIGCGDVGWCMGTGNLADCNDLWLVNPSCDYKGVEAHTMAANSTSQAKLEHVHVADTLGEALQNCSMAVGFSRRSGGLRIPNTHLSDLHIPASIKPLNLALVFGREDRGLTGAELLQCTHICTIPSSQGAGSLNLSHAVAVVLSRLYEKIPQGKSQDPSLYFPPQSTAFKTLPGTASIGAVENLMRRWELVLQTCNHATALLGLPNYKMQERMLVHVRRMLLRTGPSLREVGFLHGFLTMVERIASKIQVSQEQQKPSSCKVDT